jgi:MFS family permease
MWLPESPRWLMTHGRADEAERIVDEIEFSVTGKVAPHRNLPKLKLRPRTHTPLVEAAHTLFVLHRNRAFVGLALMAAQAFFYNAIFFTYALVLTDFFAISSYRIGLYILPFAAGNFLGPVLLGRLFDTCGRRQMIFFTYFMSGFLLALTGYLFMQGWLTAFTQTLCWMVIFFFASAAASSAYLTVSETFPLETRALAIAIFYAIGTGIGGVVGPLVFGALIDTGSRPALFAGYLFAALLMVGAALVALRYAVAAEGKPLEHVTKPLASWD